MRIALISALLVFCLSARGATNTAASTSQADVQTAVNNAARNDTVLIPNGSATWASSVTITKGLTVMNTASNVTITSSGIIFEIDPDATAIANDEIIRLSGITMDGNNASLNVVHVLGATSLAAKAFKNLAIGSCRFKNMSTTTSGNGAIIIAGQVNGCIYTNVFDRCDVIVKWTGNDDQAEFTNSAYWPPTFFDAKKLFFEGNKIQFSSSYAGQDPGWNETAQGAMGFVCRYNNYDYANVTLNQEIWDVHGYQNFNGSYNSGQTGTMESEYYGNTLINCAQFRWMNQRGGYFFMWDNILTGSSSPAIGINENVKASQVPETSPTYPVEVTNTYCWNNTVGGTIQNMVLQTDPQGSGITENRNWWNYNSSFNGTVGIGRGTSAPGGSPSVGVGYWVASTATPITTPSIIQAGTFYICWSAGVWTSMGSPYTFPHPLSVVGTPDPNITGQPVNTTVCAQNTGTFTVTASGNSALSYQWNWHGTNVSGATASSWTTPTLVSADGVSSVLVAVTDTAGTLNSSTVTLTVTADPLITVQPQNTTVSIGQTATFSVTASSCNSSVLSYQWNWFGTNVTGATSSSWTTPVLSLNESGSSVFVAVTDTAGTLNSSTVILTVTTGGTPFTMTLGQGSGAAVGTIKIGDPTGTAAKGTITISK